MSALTPDPRGAWLRVNELFHRALELDPDARGAYVEAEGQGDRILVAEVLSLLAAHDRADDFIEAPAAGSDELDALARAVPIAGRTIGPYRVERVLGEGGAGVVYLAEDTRLGRTVALKAVKPRRAGDVVLTERLRREARAAASLNHPGIATVFSLDEIEGQWYIASEYVPGVTLRDELASGVPGVVRARETGLAVARALAAAHAAGIVHRDLKPENVARTIDGRIKILDFGLAQLADAGAGTSRLTDADSFLGTPAYMAPEQIRGGPVDGRADLFSLGILVFELATGHHPFRIGPTASTVASILEDAPERLATVDGVGTDPATVALDRVISICLRKAPDERFQSVSELVDALEQATGGELAVAPEPAGPGRSPAFWWWQFHQGATAVIYLLLLGPVWQTRHVVADRLGLWLFLAGTVAVIVAGALRLHLWFAARHYPEDWLAQHSLSRRWIRAADVLFAVVLVAAGLRVIESEAPAALLVAAAAAVGVSFMVIEPATTRAAFAGVRRS